MKRSLVLTALLSVAAVPLFASLGSAQTLTVRGITERVTAATTPKRDRTRPYTFTTKGKIVLPGKICATGQTPTPQDNCLPTPVVCPPGQTDLIYCSVPGLGDVCLGKVTVRFQKQGTTISSRDVDLKPDCTYKSSVTFRSRLRTRIGSLTVRARFGGNQVLRPKSSASQTVRAG